MERVEIHDVTSLAVFVMMLNLSVLNGQRRHLIQLHNAKEVKDQERQTLKRKGKIAVKTGICCK